MTITIIPTAFDASYLFFFVLGFWLGLIAAMTLTFRH